MLGYLWNSSEDFLSPSLEENQLKHGLEGDNRKEVVSKEVRIYQLSLGLNICSFALIISVFINNLCFYLSFG